MSTAELSCGAGLQCHVYLQQHYLMKCEWGGTETHHALVFNSKVGLSEIAVWASVTGLIVGSSGMQRMHSPAAWLVC